MAYQGPVRQWDVFKADLEQVVGSEMGGEGRWVLVVSNDGFNRRFTIVTVIPLTKFDGKERKPYPFEVFLPRGIAGNPLDSLAQPFQIRTISKLRLLEPLLGRLDDPGKRQEIEDRLLDHLGIAFDSEDQGT